jgi:hypothetical protein
MHVAVAVEKRSEEDEAKSRVPFETAIDESRWVRFGPAIKLFVIA